MASDRAIVRVLAEGPVRAQHLPDAAGDERSCEVRLAPGDQLVIGRRPLADAPAVVVEDARISRRHVRVAAFTDHATVVDEDSRNGPWVDGVLRPPREPLVVAHVPAVI